MSERRLAPRVGLPVSLVSLGCLSGLKPQARVPDCAFPFSKCSVFSCPPFALHSHIITYTRYLVNTFDKENTAILRILKNCFVYVMLP